MKRYFVISDSHFGHANILNFLDKDGNNIRSFTNVDEMNETMINNWNSVVTDQDSVYHLGDVLINKKYFHLLDRLKGRKILIKGNHDIFDLSEYAQYFKDVRAYKVIADKSLNRKIILSHIPVHPNTFDRWTGGNIHGHYHEKRVLNKNKTIDKQYFNVSVEQINYTPILLDEAIERLVNQ